MVPGEATIRDGRDQPVHRERVSYAEAAGQGLKRLGRGQMSSGGA